MNISPASRRPPPARDPALSPKRDAGGFAAATRRRLRGFLSRSLFRLTHRMQNWAIALDRETIDVPTSDAPPRLWSMADEVELMLADQKAELDAHDARSVLLANIEPATLTKRTPPIKRRAALRDVKGKT